MQKNDIVTLEIKSLSSDGNGVGHVDGFAVFVPFSAVGDVVTAKLVKLQKSYAFGIIENFITPSSDRIENDCSVYARCGGCSFRHIDYTAELEAKRGFVRDALSRIAHIETGVAEVLSPANHNRYRNKVQFPVFEPSPGRLSVGFFASRSHRVVPVEDCVLQDEILNKIAHSVCRKLSAAVTAYDETTKKGALKHIVLRRSSLTSEIMLCLVINADGINQEAEFVEAITSEFAEISTIVININRQNTNVIMGKNCRTIFGEGFISDMLCGVPVRISPLSFFQINNGAAELLYKKVKGLAAPCRGDTVLDLYCGAGTIGLSMAAACKKLIGVEIVPQAVADARFNAAKMGAQNAEFIESDAGTAAKMLLERGEAIDIAVVDPPRKGCDELTLESLRLLAPNKIVMVSCNPATLARDLAYLESAGYEAGTVYPVDMFPRTKHVEAVVMLSRKKAQS